ncbi:MAG: hypothetical protein Q7T05_05620 [Dehalococcoidia bacterium]|nr:hypothetical protein [Dehalococcoidia bacterium]
MRTISKPGIRFEDIKEGAELPPKTLRLNVPIIIRWCAATEIFVRRDHFDLGYVQKYTDLKDIVGGGVWATTYLMQQIKNWAGVDGWVWKMNAQTRSHMFPGDVLTTWGRVTGTSVKNGLGYVELEARLKLHDDVDAVTSTAVVVLPVAGGRPVPYPFQP